MVNTGDALDFPIKLHAGRVRSGCGFQVFSGAQFGEHLALDAPLLLLAVTRRASKAVPSGLRCSLMFCCCDRRSSCASCRIIRLQAAGSRFASRAASQSSTLCRSSTFHRPHFVGYVGFRHRFYARYGAVCADNHALRELQIEAEITQIVAQDIDVKGKSFRAAPGC